MTSEVARFQIRLDENGLGPVIVLTSGMKIDVSEAMRRNNARAIRLSEAMGWAGKDLSVLDDISPESIDSLEIYSSKIKDLSTLSRFSGLKKLGLQTKDVNGFSASTFPDLEILLLGFSKPVLLDQLPKSLKLLKITGFGGEDLSVLPDAPKLEHLAIYGRSLKSLEGIGRYIFLSKVTIGDAHSLTDISTLDQLEKLVDLRIHGANRLSSIKALAANRSLKRLEFDRCGNIESIAPLGSLQALEELLIGESMTVIDGDLSALKRLPHLRRLVLAPRRNYSPSVAEVRAQMTERR